MPTIKTSNGKVVLKNGKVSCSCCAQPTGCCMYSADELANGLYTVDDLPDTIILELTNQIQPGPEYCPREVLSRSDDGYLYGYGNPLDTTPGNKAARISLFFSEEQQIWFFSYLQVEYKDPGAGTENRVYIGGWEDTCLLEDVSDELIIEDQFDPCYKIFLQPPDSSETYIDTLERKTLCKWDNIIGFDENGFPIFNNWSGYVELRFVDSIQRWFADISGVPFYFEKSPPQDTPVGSYPSPPIYPGGPSYIVTVQSC